MLLVNIPLVFTALSTIFLSLIIFASNSRKRINQVLSLFILSLFLWIVTNLLTNLSSSPQTALIFARSTLIGAAFIPYLFLIFCDIFTGRNSKKSKYVLWFVIPFIILLTTPSEFNIVSVQEYGIGAKSGIIYYLVILEFISYFGIGLTWLYRMYKRKETYLIQRVQLRYIFFGVILTLIPGVFANAILLSAGYDAAAYFGPNFVIFLAFFMSASIVKHRLLDIKLIVARSVAYVFTLATIGFIYGLGAFSILGIFISQSQQISFSQQAVYTVLAIILVFTFQPIKKFFDKVSNKIFYRDAYDTQEVLDKLGSIIVGQIDLDVIMRETLDLFNENIRPQNSVFLLINDKNEYYKRFGDPDLARGQEVDALDDLERSQKNTVMIVDEETDGIESWKSLKKNDVAVSVRMNTTTQTVGYLLLGAKKSGNIYSSQDSKLLNIASSELAIATENALRFDEIQKFNITLQKKIEDATAQLRRTNEKLRALDEAKDEFISMASHQLRTPLTSIKGYVSMLMDGDAGKPNKNQIKLLEEAFASSQRMVYLIADLLNVSRLKTGKFVIEPTNIFMPKVVQGEIDQVLPTAKAKKITLSYDAPKHFPMVSLDETKIRQVIMNFVDNAIYYTPQGGKIDIQLIAKKDVIEYKVVDNGIGVPKEQQAKLFSKFFRADNAKKARPDGTGLGLYMASKVVSAQGGSIIFSSEVGKGSTFGFSFPLSKVKAKKS